MLAYFFFVAKSWWILQDVVGFFMNLTGMASCRPRIAVMTSPSHIMDVVNVCALCWAYHDARMCLLTCFEWVNKSSSVWHVVTIPKSWDQDPAESWWRGFEMELTESNGRKRMATVDRLPATSFVYLFVFLILWNSNEEMIRWLESEFSLWLEVKGLEQQWRPPITWQMKFWTLNQFSIWFIFFVCLLGVASFFFRIWKKIDFWFEFYPQFYQFLENVFVVFGRFGAIFWWYFLFYCCSFWGWFWGIFPLFLTVFEVDFEGFSPVF